MLIYTPNEIEPMVKQPSQLTEEEKAVLLRKLEDLLSEHPYIDDKGPIVVYDYNVVLRYLRLQMDLNDIYNEAAIQQLATLEYFIATTSDYEKAIDFVPNMFYIHM